MIYYVMLWCVRRFLADRIAAVITAIGIMSAVVYVWWFPYKYETGETGMYEDPDHTAFVPVSETYHGTQSKSEP